MNEGPQRNPLWDALDHSGGVRDLGGHPSDRCVSAGPIVYLDPSFWDPSLFWDASYFRVVFLLGQLNQAESWRLFLRQVKVVLAAAMWQNPHVLILDEPTNYLDREGLGALILAIKDRSRGPKPTPKPPVGIDVGMKAALYAGACLLDFNQVCAFCWKL